MEGAKDYLAVPKRTQWTGPNLGPLVCRDAYFPGFYATPYRAGLFDWSNTRIL